MKRLRSLAAVLFLCVCGAVQAADGLVAVKSPRGYADTVARLEDAIGQRGLTLVARVDHAAGAAKVGRTLRPTLVVIFGNPQGGTPFMECAQSVGIDLPLKALVWQDEAGQVWLGYNDPAYLGQRHGVPQCPAVANLQKALAGLAGAVVAP